MITEQQIIKVLCEIAIHVGLCDSEPTIDNVIKGLRKANCKKCDELASELLALQGEEKEQPKLMKDIVINYSAGKPTDSRIDCETKRVKIYPQSTIQDALMLFENHCMHSYPKGSQIVITSIKMKL